MNILNLIKIQSSRQGFTIAEIVVSVFLIMISILMIMQVSIFVSTEVNYQTRGSKAISVASANLNKYLDRETLPSAFNCSTHNSYSNAYVALSNSSSNREPKPEGNWGTFDQEVRLYARAGCDAPITVESSIKHGHGGNLRKVTRAGYAQ